MYNDSNKLIAEQKYNKTKATQDQNESLSEKKKKKKMFDIIQNALNGYIIKGQQIMTNGPINHNFVVELISIEFDLNEIR